MTLQILDIPEDTNELPGWLETQLLGEDLGALVAELAAVHEPAPDAVSLNALLGEAQPRVLESGLSALSADQLRGLLQHPALLLDLQERLLIDGGRYWQDRLASSDSDDRLIASTWDRLQQTIQPPATVSFSSETAWYRRPLFVSLTTAAAVLLIVVGIRQFRAPEPQTVAQGWGWNKADALPQDVSAKEYLNQLADGADAWFNKRPETRDALATRILQFRQGCSRLLTAEHKPLSADDRQWLRERCRAWAERIDAHLAAAESAENSEQVLKARGEMDATVKKLIAALQSRAKSLS